MAQFLLEEPLLIYVARPEKLSRHYTPEGIYYFNGKDLSYTEKTQLEKKNVSLTFNNLSKMNDQEIIDKITEANAWVYWDTPYFLSITPDNTGKNTEYVFLFSYFINHPPKSFTQPISNYLYRLRPVAVNYELYNSQYEGYEDDYSDGKKILIWRTPEFIENIILDSPKSTYSNALLEPTFKEVHEFYSQYDSFGHSIYEDNESDQTISSSSNLKNFQYESSEKFSQYSDSSKNSSNFEGYILPHSSTKLLNSQDIASLTLQELNYARNEIFARHGRMFKSKELQNYFNNQSWYTPLYSPDTFDDSVLSDIENQNIQTLLNAEHAINPNGYPLS